MGKSTINGCFNRKICDVLMGKQSVNVAFSRIICARVEVRRD
jgi:hypothetical protein